MANQTLSQVWTNGKLLEAVETYDWDCATDDTRYLTHGIHRYSGKFIPQIASQAVRLVTKPGDLIVDPYCGSGTTLLEAALLDRRAIGIDLNPLAVLISQVKTTPVQRELLLKCARRLRIAAAPLLQAPEREDLFDPPKEIVERLSRQVHTDARWQHPWYMKWFKDHVRFELIALHQAILAEPIVECRNVALLAFSDILRKSSNAHSSYPNVMFDKNRGAPPAAVPRFLSRLEQIIDAVSLLEGALTRKPIPRVLRGNARQLPLPDDSVDAIVTHPPYIGSIPYAEYGVLSLVWLGYDPRSLDGQLTGGRRQSSNVVDQFRQGFFEMILESWRVLRPGGIMFMLLGSPTVKGRKVDLSKMARELSEHSGFSLAALHKRNGVNRRANLMGQEQLLFFLKPKMSRSKGRPSVGSRQKRQYRLQPA